MEEILKIAFNSTAVYIFIIISIRIFGKKELTQLTVIDLVFILLISNSVQNAMVGSNSSLLGGMAAAFSLFVVNFVLKYLFYKFPGIGKAFQGEAVLLIYEGELNTKNMVKAKLSLDEINEAIREHGVSSIDQVDLAVLEIDGSISIVSDEYKRRTVKKRKSSKAVTKQQ
ncbi:MAG: DUF421 domain-containing protein [Eubacteriaceae bacterium]|nr:DUF421 domain-containing protein [Eubacteriaceae bacterium]